MTRKQKLATKYYKLVKKICEYTGETFFDNVAQEGIEKASAPTIAEWEDSVRRAKFRLSAAATAKATQDYYDTAAGTCARNEQEQKLNELTQKHSDLMGSTSVSLREFVKTTFGDGWDIGTLHTNTFTIGMIDNDNNFKRGLTFEVRYGKDFDGKFYIQAYTGALYISETTNDIQAFLQGLVTISTPDVMQSLKGRLVSLTQKIGKLAKERASIRAWLRYPVGKVFDTPEEFSALFGEDE